MRTKFLIVVNDPAFFVAQHMHIGHGARDEGYDVHVAGPSGEGTAEIRANGFHFHPVRISRGKVRLHRELIALWDLYRLYRRICPQLVYHITLKAILYGTLAARWSGVPAVVNANTGLGYSFIDEGKSIVLMRHCLEAIYRRGIRHANRHDLFLNPDDRELFISKGLASDDNSSVITGPGVDMDLFLPLPEPHSVPVVVLASRMLWHKGVEEFVEAAHMLRMRGVKARFVLVGKPDPGNLATVTRSTLLSWKRDGVVEWWGYCRYMEEVFARSHIVVLPSYREGLGKVLIEGAACARPLVATDVPGCREIARDNQNALLVRPRDSYALADALGQLIADASLRRRLGRRGREIAETEFSLRVICQLTMAICLRMLPPARRPHHLRLVQTARGDERWNNEEPVLAHCNGAISLAEAGSIHRGS